MLVQGLEAFRAIAQRHVALAQFIKQTATAIGDQQGQREAGSYLVAAAQVVELRKGNKQARKHDAGDRSS